MIPRHAADGDGSAAGSVLTRRVVLGAGITAGLSALACAPVAAPPVPTPTASPVVTPPTSPSAAPDPLPSPSPTPTGPDPTEVAARFADAEPQRWGMDLPGIVGTLEEPLTADGRPRVALTFDACGGRAGSGFDAELIDGLIAAQVPATLFLNLRWIEANPEVVARLIAEPLFELGNHGTRHVPLSVTGREAYGIAGSASAQEAVDEVWGCHERLTALTGVAPRLFRSGTAHYDDVGVAIVSALGEVPVGFRTNGDAGATYPAATVRSEVRATAPGGIVIGHFNRPDGETAEGVLAAIRDMQADGVAFVHL
ncbi:MAG TPA: polysaccharide deacetylase family protein [Arachnia sp.]|nr:polysaccharide deacetylase family protein [Arachnia sp.]HMT86361.1 polysaccharide deacetylase family protein [Arachnia sp.]